MRVQTLLSQEHFRELSKRVQVILREQKERGFHYEMLYFVLRLAVYALGIAIFAIDGLVFKVLGLLVASFGFYAVAITGTHETRHGCFRSTEKANRRWAYFFSDFWAGQSNKWWHHRHVVVHHVYTNIPTLEPSRFYYPKLQPYLYFFVAPFLVNIWLFVRSVQYLFTQPLRDLVAYLFVQACGWVFHIGVFAWFVSLPWAVVCAIVMRAGFSPAFMHIAVFNHVGLPELDRKTAWLPHQAVTTRNLKKNPLLTVIGGNAFIECHLEHHLFPNLSNYMLGKIRPTVRAFLHEHGYAYVEEGYLMCLRNCIKQYHEIFQRSPIQVIESS